MLNYKTVTETRLEFIAVAAVSELPNGERLFFEIENLPIVVFNIGGQYFAIGDVCSHDDGPLGDGEVEGLEVICPRHGARFDLKTGKVLALPAVEDIPAYPVRVVAGEILIGLPKA